MASCADYLRSGLRKIIILLLDSINTIVGLKTQTSCFCPKTEYFLPFWSTSVLSFDHSSQTLLQSLSSRTKLGWTANAEVIAIIVLPHMRNKVLFWFCFCQIQARVSFGIRVIQALLINRIVS